MIEIWKPIKGFEGRYEVSNLGRVKSLDMEVFNGRAYYNKTGRILKVSKSGNYQVVSLGKSTRRLVHRIVAETFLENPHDKKTVNHKDGNKDNNKVDNLEWLTQKENNLHARINGLNNVKGENNPMCKFTDKLVLEMRNKFETGLYKQSELAEMFGVSRMQTHRIVTRKLRRDAR
jgi:predicted XRE-type DNA-binding protein